MSGGKIGRYQKKKIGRCREETKTKKTSFAKREETREK